MNVPNIMGLIRRAKTKSFTITASITSFMGYCFLFQWEHKTIVALATPSQDLLFISSLPAHWSAFVSRTLRTNHRELVIRLGHKKSGLFFKDAYLTYI